MATDPQSLYDQAACDICYAPNEYAMILLEAQADREVVDNPPTPSE